MRPNSKHYILLLIGLGSAIFASIGYWYVYNSIVVNAKNKIMVLNEIETNNKNRENENALIEIGKKSEIERKNLPSYFITEDKILDFIDSVEDIERISSTTMNLSSISKDESSDHIKVNVEIKGEWSNVRRGLSLLENLPYSINIDNMNLSNTSEVWTMSLSIRALYLK